MTDESAKPSFFERLSALWAGQEHENSPQMLIKLIREQGQVSEDTAHMMENLLEFNQTQVRHIMIPRGQMVLIQENDSLDKALATVLEVGHSRYPVVDEEHRALRGILLAKDLLGVIARGETATVLDLVRPATIVPESKPLDAMLRQFKSNRNHMALVIDEYGSLSGLITIEDVIEEIVGEIDDEHDEVAGASIIANGDGSFQVQALATIEEFNEFFQTDLSDEHADTIGGYVLEQCDRLPAVGESMRCDSWLVTVLRADKKRLITLNFRPLAEEEDADEAAEELS